MLGPARWWLIERGRDAGPFGELAHRVVSRVGERLEALRASDVELDAALIVAGEPSVVVLLRELFRWLAFHVLVSRALAGYENAIGLLAAEQFALRAHGDAGPPRNAHAPLDLDAIALVAVLALEVHVKFEVFF